MIFLCLALKTLSLMWNLSLLSTLCTVNWYVNHLGLLLLSTPHVSEIKNVLIIYHNFLFSSNKMQDSN